jgi:hypothetical protein
LIDDTDFGLLMSWTAVAQNQVSVVRKRLATGTQDVNAPDSDGQSALRMAAMKDVGGRLLFVDDCASECRDGILKRELKMTAEAIDTYHLGDVAECLFARLATPARGGRITIFTQRRQHCSSLGRSMGA